MSIPVSFANNGVLSNDAVVNEGVIKEADINTGDLRYGDVVNRAMVGGCVIVVVVVIVIVVFDEVADEGSRALRGDADDVKGVATADTDAEGVVDDVAGSHWPRPLLHRVVLP